MKIVDCFMFYNELDLLNYRLNILNHVVDYFIIVESMYTFMGNEKKLYYNENKELFKDFNEKIIHIIIDEVPYKTPNVNNKEQWINEIFQRNAISRGIKSNELSLEDLLIIADLDEIPDPNTLDKIKKGIITVTFNTLLLDNYYYNLNSKVHTNPESTKIITYEKYKELNISCNDIRHSTTPNILNGGWHLSYFGDPHFIKNKMNEFSHQEYNNDTYTNLHTIEEKIKNFKDMYNRQMYIENINVKDNNYLPPQYEKYLTKYYK
jgi:beta-1,4-mannosyl-glycoprotein beta-1,4-N-acetylglucosaminyltransferase